MIILFKESLMRSSRIIVAGVFCGATIEPGTFHLGPNLVGNFCGGALPRHVSDGMSQREAQAAGTSPNIAQVRSAPSENTDAPIPPNTERAADATPN
jgi:hypothetical protein